MVAEEELQKVAVAIYGVMRAPKADHAATAALAMGHAGVRVPLPLPSKPIPAGRKALKPETDCLLPMVNKSSLLGHT